MFVECEHCRSFINIDSAKFCLISIEDFFYFTLWHKIFQSRVGKMLCSEFEDFLGSSRQLICGAARSYFREVGEFVAGYNKETKILVLLYYAIIRRFGGVIIPKNSASYKQFFFASNSPLKCANFCCFKLFLLAVSSYPF